jgi:hypothetical protein
MSDDFYGPGEAGTLLNSKNAADVRIDELSPEEQRAIVEKAQALRELLGQKDLAKYKIEVLFDRRKTTRGSFPGAMTVWRSGSVLGGGGDEILYPCPDTACQGYIGAEHIAPMSRTAFCMTCHRIWNQGDLTEIRFFRLDPAKWAYVIAREFIRAECRADVYMKTAGSESLRQRTEVAQHSAGAGEQLFAARDARQPVMYSLKDIIKDASAGASIEARMRALITS